jgi:hypothetical protein
MSDSARIFGLPVWRETLSDEQYVAKVRKGLRDVRWMRWFHGAVGIVFIGLCIWGVIEFSNILTSVAEHEDRPIVLSAFGVAILLGLLSGLWLAKAWHSIANAFFGYRRDRLLVQCWDAAHKDQRE